MRRSQREEEVEAVEEEEVDPLPEAQVQVYPLGDLRESFLCHDKFCHKLTILKLVNIPVSLPLCSLLLSIDVNVVFLFIPVRIN